MAVADFAREWFESEPLRATIAAGGMLGSFLGPWSAGSAARAAVARRGRGTSDRERLVRQRRHRRGRRRAGRRRAPGGRRDPNRRRRRADRRERRGGDRRDAGDAARRSRRAPSSRTPIRSGRCSGWSIRCTSRPSSCGRPEHPRARHAGEDQLRRLGAAAIHRRRATLGERARGAVRPRAACPRHRRASSAPSTPPNMAASRRPVDRADDPVDPRPDARARRGSTWSRRTCSTRRITCAARPGTPSASGSPMPRPHDRALRARLRIVRRRARDDHAAGSRAHLRDDRRPDFSRRARARPAVRRAPAARLGAIRDADSCTSICAAAGTHPGTGLDGRAANAAHRILGL